MPSKHLTPRNFFMIVVDSRPQGTPFTLPLALRVA